MSIAASASGGERQIISNQRAYSEGLMEELNVKAKETEELRQECERLKAQQAQKQ